VSVAGEDNSEADSIKGAAEGELPTVELGDTGTGEGALPTARVGTFAAFGTCFWVVTR
jgi:hypothetical protein